MPDRLKLREINDNKTSEFFIRQALKYLLEEAYRNKSYNMALVLQEAFSCCESIAHESMLPEMTPTDSLRVIHFLKSFLELDHIQRQCLLEKISDHESLN